MPAVRTPETTLMQLIRPTNGSAVVLKTIAPNGPAGSRVRVSACSVRGFTASTGAACLGEGEQRHDGIEQGADADRFPGGSTEDRHYRPGRHALGERPGDLGITQLTTLQVLLEQRVVRFGGRLDQGRPAGLDFGRELARHWDLFRSPLLVELVGLAGQEIDDPLKAASSPIGAWMATGRGENSLKLFTAFQ